MFYADYSTWFHKREEKESSLLTILQLSMYRYSGIHPAT